MDLNVVIPLLVLVVISVPTVRALSRSLTTPVTRAAVQSYAVAMGRLALALGAAAAVLLSLLSIADDGAWQIPLVTAACVVLLAILERQWPRQRGTVRVATVRRRTLWSVVRRSRVVFAAAGALAMGTAVVAELGMRSPVPGTDGNLIGVAVTQAAPEQGAQVSALTLTVTQPVPSLLGDWIAVGGLIVVAALAALAIRQVLRRPMLADVDEETDAALRRMSAERLLRLIGATAFGCAGVMCSETSSALYFLGVQAKGVVVGMAWLFNIGAWIGGLAVLVAFYAGPIKLPRMARAGTDRPPGRSR